jgi:hypothetical protein
MKMLLQDTGTVLALVDQVSNPVFVVSKCPTNSTTSCVEDSFYQQSFFESALREMSVPRAMWKFSFSLTL